MTLRDRLRSLLGRTAASDECSTDHDALGDGVACPDCDHVTELPPLEPPHLDDVAILPPADCPEECPNCGAAFDAATDLVAPDTGMVRFGEHSHACRIGTSHEGPLAGWTVVHR